MKKEIYLLLIIFSIARTVAYTQPVYFTRTGKIEFHAGTSLEDIDATNNEVTSILDIQKGTIGFQVLIKSFHFRRALMEEHFNENYLESSVYPKATFSGKIINPEKINFSADGNYSITIEGDLTIHGITKKISTSAVFNVLEKKISGKCSFKVNTDDFNIKIPSVVADKISKAVNITVQCMYEPRN